MITWCFDDLKFFMVHGGVQKMGYKRKVLFRDFDYEEDDYDRLNNVIRRKDQKSVFTNKAKIKKFEFDYEEDPYEPEK